MLLDQIHLWAVTEFRTFVIEHLRPWHAFCDENYLLDWDSIYDTGLQRKRKRTYSKDGDLSLPNWTNLLDESARLKILARAKESLERATKEHQRRKGKAKCLQDADPDHPIYYCTRDDCLSTAPKFESHEAFLNHIRCVHGEKKWNLFSLKRILEQAEKESWGTSLPTPCADTMPGPSRKRIRAQ